MAVRRNMSVGWVAYGGDGRVWNNSDHVYGDIDRSALSGFDLLVNDHPVLMVVVHPHEVGQFTYRKRTRKFVGGGGQVMHVVGFADSHAWVYDEQRRVVFESGRASGRGRG